MSPPHRRPAGLTQAPPALPHAGAGAPRSQLCLPIWWSPLPSEPHFPELQNRSGQPTFCEKMGVEMLEKAGVGPAWPCCLPEPCQPPPQLGLSIPPVLLRCSSIPRELLWLHSCCRAPCRPVPVPGTLPPFLCDKPIPTYPQVSVLMSPPQGSHLLPLAQHRGPSFTI